MRIYIYSDIIGQCIQTLLDKPYRLENRHTIHEQPVSCQDPHDDYAQGHTKGHDLSRCVTPTIPKRDPSIKNRLLEFRTIRRNGESTNIRSPAYSSSGVSPITPQRTDNTTTDRAVDAVRGGGSTLS